VRVRQLTTLKSKCLHHMNRADGQNTPRWPSARFSLSGGQRRTPRRASSRYPHISTPD
jgi:hypothetical protein